MRTITRCAVAVSAVAVAGGAVGATTVSAAIVGDGCGGYVAVSGNAAYNGSNCHMWLKDASSSNWQGPSGGWLPGRTGTLNYSVTDWKVANPV